MTLLLFVFQCRSPGIYKPHYLHELVSRYGDLREAIAPPELPDWCLDEEDDLSDSEYQNGQTAEDGSRPDGSRKRFKRDPRLKVTSDRWPQAHFRQIAGVPGEKP